MLSKRAVEAAKSTTEECILLMGKNNNIIKWRENMQTLVTELYGIVGMFFTTNVRYELPKNPIKYLDGSSSEDSTSDSENEEVPTVEELAARIAYAAAKPARDVAREARNERRRRTNTR